MQVRFSIIWKLTSSFSRTNVYLFSRTQTYILRMAGHLYLEWPSKVGESAFRAMLDIIQTLLMRINQWGISHLKLPERSSIVQLRQPVTNWPMSSQSVTVRPMNAWWMAHHNWRKLIRNHLLYVPYVSGKCHLTSVSMERSLSYTQN